MNFSGNFTRIFLATLASVLFSGAVFSQANVSILQGDTILVACGDQVGLSVSSGGFALNNNFNNGTAGPGWITTAGALFNNPCGVNPLSNNTYLWMGPATPHPRSLTTNVLDVSCGGDVIFQMKYALQGTPAPCEGPDLYNEGVRLEYDAGTGWTYMGYWTPDSSICGAGGCNGQPPSPMLNWATYTVPIPTAAQTSATQFRWIQVQSSSNPFDHWGLDQVEITNGCQGQLFWSTGDTTDSITSSPMMTSGWVWAALTNTIDTVYDSIYVDVRKPQFQALASEDTVCPGVQVDLEIDTANAQFLASQVTYNYSWFPSTLVANSTAQSTSANINFPTTLIATIIHPSFPSCSNNDTLNIVVDNTLYFDNVTITDENCGLSQGGIADGTIAIGVEGGTGNYAYNVNNTGFSPSNVAAGLTNGTYTINILDSLTNCYMDTAVNVGLLPGLNLESLLIGDVSCRDKCDGTVASEISGAVGTPTFSWNGTGLLGQNLDTVTGICAGNITLEIQDDHCLFIEQLNVTEPDSLLANATMGSTKICMRENTTLTTAATGGTPPYSYNWNSLPSSASHSVTPDEPTEYSVFVTDVNGCVTDTSFLFLDVFPPITTYNTDDTICPNKEATVGVTALGGNGNYNYIWSGNATDQAFLNTSPEFESAYFVTVDDGCVWPEIDTVFVNLYPLPDPKFDVAIDDHCVPSDAVFTFNGTRVQEVFWNFGNGDSTNAITTKIKANYTEGGVYPVKLRVVSTDKCILQWSESIEVFDPPVADFTWNERKEYDILNNTVALLNTSENATRYEWDFPTGDSEEENPTVELAREHGRYFIDLTAYNDAGCVDRTKKSIFLKPRVAIWVPNSFTPNDDGVNDVFVPRIDGEILDDSYQISIFTRWGEEAFSSSDVTEAWRGKGAPDGTYVWKISYKNALNELIKEQGTVHLMR